MDDISQFGEESVGTPDASSEEAQNRADIESALNGQGPEDEVDGPLKADVSEPEGTPKTEPEGTPLSEEDRETYGVGTVEELKTLVAKAQNADKVITKQGDELGELRKIKEQIEALTNDKAQAESDVQSTEATERLKSTVESGIAEIQKALTDGDYKTEDIGKNIMSSILGVIHEVLPHYINPAISQYDSWKSGASKDSAQIQELKSSIETQYPNLKDKTSDLWIKTREILTTKIPKELSKSVVGKFQSVLMAAELAEAELIKEGKATSRNATDSTLKKAKDKANVITRGKTVVDSTRKDDIDDLIAAPIHQDYF